MKKSDRSIFSAKTLLAFVILCSAFFTSIPNVLGSSREAPVLAQKTDAVALVRSLVNSTPAELDYGQVKLAVDEFVEPSADPSVTEANLNEMQAALDAMLHSLPNWKTASSLERLKLLRTFIYQPGYWNQNKPFQYNFADPLGSDIKTQLLSSYIATKKGNCVSMPILFLILGERLGLKLTLSTAPLHIFVKFTDEASGNTWNLETTSGAGFTRDIWYRQKLPMSEKSIETGAYLKALSRQQAIAVIATPILDYLLEKRDYDQAIAVANALLEAWPENVYALVKEGTAYHGLLQDKVISKYPTAGEMPADIRAYAEELYEGNQKAFQGAENLGWTPM